VTTKVIPTNITPKCDSIPEKEEGPLNFIRQVEG
jgi:hypothetical protein